MPARDEAIDQEARALWRALREEPPPENLRGSDLLGLLIGQSTTLAYDRLCSPFLRPSQISRPPTNP